MSGLPAWSTACPDWERRIVAGDPLIPFDPLFPDEAEEGMKVFGNLRLVDLAERPHIRDVARPFLTQFVQAIFGAYDAVNGQQLIREFLWLVSKKNAKSTIAAAIMLTALIRNWRFSNEAMILAPTKLIAENSFKPMVDMVRADNSLFKLLHIKENQKTVVHRNTNADLKVIAADTESVGGGKKAFVFIDELWLFGKKSGAASMFREALGGLSVRPEGFCIYASTQSSEPPRGVFDAKLKQFRDIRDGKIIDNKKLAVMYEFPAKMIKKKQFLDPKNFYITNPNMGASFEEQDILDDFKTSKEGGASTLADFLAKRLNIQIGVGLRSDGWAGAQVWEKGADTTITLESLIQRCEVLIMSVDGGGLDDLLGLCVMGREPKKEGETNGKWLTWNKAFISPIGMERRQANETAYEEFIEEESLVKVEHLEEDVAAVVEIAKQCKASGKLHSVGLDPAGLGILVDEMKAIGITAENEKCQLVGVKQGIALMGAIKAVERKLESNGFKHAGQALMAWCAGNAVAQQTPTGMRIARDESGYGKIDPLMATFNCGALMSLNPKAAGAGLSDFLRAHVGIS